MKRIFSLLAQDFLLLLRNALFWVVTAALVIIVATINFLIPADFTSSESSLVVFGFDYAVPGSAAVQSPQEVEQAVREKGAVGLIAQDGNLTLLQSGLSEEAATALVSLLTPPSSTLAEVDTHVLRENTGAIAQNKRLTPVFICFEAIVLGFLMAGVLMLGEKQEQTLRAYRVSPGGAFAYIASKTLLLALLGTLYALLMTVFTIGIHFDWFNFIAISLLGCAFYSLLGLCVTVFFRDISSWFFLAALILSINMLPSVSYSVPTFSPAWISHIPSYTTIFAYEEILFDTGKSLSSAYLLLSLETAAAFALSMFLIKKKLLTAAKGV